MLLVAPLYVCRPFCPKNLKLSWKEDPKKRKIRCRYNWTMSINKELFQFAGKKRPRISCQMELLGPNLARGCPLWRSIGKKIGKIGRDINSIFSLALEKFPFFTQFLSWKQHLRLSRRATKCRTKHVCCSLALRATQFEIFAVKVKKFPFLPIWDGNLQFWSTKSSIWTKCQQDKVLTICPGGRVPIFSKICWKLFKIV